MELFLTAQTNQAIKELITDAKLEQRILEKIKSEPLKLDQVKTLKIKPCGLEI